jgi:hypothetical protein
MEPKNYSNIAGDNSGIVVTGDANQVNVHHGPRVPTVAAAVEHLRLGLHTQARVQLQEILRAQPADAEALFYSAVATLEGRRASLCSLQQIREAENLTRSAIALQDRGLFHYFLAYLAIDYYERKCLHSPIDTASELVAIRRTGANIDGIAHLRQLLRVPEPFPPGV